VAIRGSEIAANSNVWNAFFMEFTYLSEIVIREHDSNKMIRCVLKIRNAEKRIISRFSLVPAPLFFARSLLSAGGRVRMAA
jgi:hypothetical protein